MVSDEPSSSSIKKTSKETTPETAELQQLQPQEEQQDEEGGEEQDEQKKSSSSGGGGGSTMMMLQATGTRHAAPSPLGPSEAGGKLPKGGAAGVVEGVGVVVGQYEVARDRLAGQLREVEATLVDQLHRLPPPTSPSSSTVCPPKLLLPTVYYFSYSFFNLTLTLMLIFIGC
jgi:hypothetical protein